MEELGGLFFFKKEKKIKLVDSNQIQVENEKRVMYMYYYLSLNSISSLSPVWVSSRSIEKMKC